MIHKLLTLFFLSLFISCKTLNKQEIYGTYKYKHDEYFISIKLTDSIFEYNFNWDLGNQKSSGTWELKGNKIFLKSDPYYKSNFLEVSESSNRNEKSYIEVLTEDGDPYYGISIKVNGTDEFSTNNGKIYIDTYPQVITSIQVFALDVSYPNNFYKVKNVNSNIFVIVAKEDPYAKEYFDNKKIKIKRNKIYIDNDVLVKS